MLEIEEKLLGAKIKYKGDIIPKNKRNDIQITNMVYPAGFMTGDWFEIDRVSGCYFDFKNSPRVGIIPFTMANFPNTEWEWSF